MDSMDEWIKLFQTMMLKLNASEVVMVFDGQGDCGMASIHSIKIGRKRWRLSKDMEGTDKELGVMALPDMEAVAPVSFWCPESGKWSSENKHRKVNLEEIVDYIVWNYVEGGWENDSGGFGEIVLKPDGVEAKTVFRKRYGSRNVNRRPSASSMEGGYVHRDSFQLSAMQLLEHGLTNKEDGK